MRSTSLKFQPFPNAPEFQPFPNAPAISHSPDNPAGKPVRSSLSKSVTLVAMSLGYGVVQLDVTIVNTALNSIGSSLGGGAELQWVVNAYTIAFAAFILTAGALGDRIGAKRVFTAGFAIFTAASVACALAPNAVTLIAARAVQGLGAAILVPNSLALLSHAYPDEKAARPRGRYLGRRRQPCVDVRAAARWRIDRTGRLAVDLFRQSADRPCRPVAEPSLCHRDHAVAAARDRFAGPDRGDRVPRLSCRRDHRRRFARLEQSIGDRGLCCLRDARDPVRLAGTACAAADVAAVAVLPSALRADIAGRPSCQRRLLWTDLRFHPVLPARQRMVGVHDGSGIPAGDGRGAAGQSGRRTSLGADRRARDDPRRP